MRPVWMMGFSAFFYSLQYLDARLLRNDFCLWMVTFCRGLSGLLVIMVCMACWRTPHPLGLQKRALCSRGILGATNIALSFYAVQHLQLSVATTLLSTAPLYTGILTCCVHRLQWKWGDTVSGVFCLGGVILMSYEKFTNPPDRYFYWGFIAANGAAFVNALINISIYGVREESALTIVGYAMFFGTLTAIPGLWVGTQRHHIPFWNESNNTLKLWLALVGTGSLSVVAQLLKTNAIQASQENIRIVLLRYLDIPFSIAWDCLFFGSRLTMREIVGIVCILIGVMIRGLMKKPCRTSPRPTAFPTPNPTPNPTSTNHCIVEIIN